MSNQELTPSEARAIIRQHVHDLRNMINCMELEIACLLEDPAVAPCGPALQKVRDQLALTERGLQSLSVRFVEPSPNIVAATDLFHNWRQQIHKLGRGPLIHWEEPACNAAITVDFNAVVAVLCEICLQPNFPAGSRSLAAGIAGQGDSVSFFVREPAPEREYQDSSPDTQQWTEWERMVTTSGGRLERTYDQASAHSVTSLRFPSTL